MASRDPQEKIDRIILAAVNEFARAGPDGARVDAIASASGVNKRLLYHYVGDKDALFQAAVEHCRTRLQLNGSSREQVPVEVWRILCHEVVRDPGTEFESEAAAVLGTDEDSAAAESRLALAMFRSMLAPLALGLTRTVEAARLPSVQNRPAVQSVDEQKPRIRLKPELRRHS